MKKMFIIYAEYYDYDDSDRKCLMVVASEERAKYWVKKAKRIYSSALLTAAKRQHRQLVEQKKTKSAFIWWYKRNIYKLGLATGTGWHFEYEKVMVTGG